MRVLYWPEQFNNPLHGYGQYDSTKIKKMGNREKEEETQFRIEKKCTRFFKLNQCLILDSWLEFQLVFNDLTWFWFGDIPSTTNFFPYTIWILRCAFSCYFIERHSFIRSFVGVFLFIYNFEAAHCTFHIAYIDTHRVSLASVSAHKLFTKFLDEMKDVSL